MDLLFESFHESRRELEVQEGAAFPRHLVAWRIGSMHAREQDPVVRISNERNLAQEHVCVLTEHPSAYPAGEAVDVLPWGRARLV